MDPHIRKEVSLDSKGGYGGSRVNSCVNSRVGSRENLCEECIQNPLDLIDASIQVDLSDSENEWDSDGEGGGGKGGGCGDDVTMGKRRGGELGVNKKGTPLYSREDIREQYCINDKELQVLDRQGSKGFFGCFSNNGQPGYSPCSGNKSRKSILGSCIARTSSEEELQNQIQTSAKRPISPGLRSTTWNGQHRYFDPVQDEEDGFDEQYFRRRPKSFCVPPGGPGGPQARYLPPGAPGMPQGGPQPLGIPAPGVYMDPRLQIGPQAEADPRMMAYAPHPLLRTTPYPSVGPMPPVSGVTPPIPSSSTYGGGYTLPPTAAYFPVGTYSNVQAPLAPGQTTLVELQHEGTGMTQPNTPDLLMHRRQGGTPEVSLDDRKQKHVSFDSSSLMRSQTLATMDEATFHRIQANQTSQITQATPPINVNNTTPSKSYERLIDGKVTPDYEYFNQVLPPELARQIMMDRLKRNSMRTQATQTDTSRNRHSSHIPISPKTAHKVFMVSEGVQTNGFNNGSSLPVLPPPAYPIPPPPLATATATSPIRNLPPMEYTSPAHMRATATSPHLPGNYQLQVYHLDGRDVNGIHGPELSTWAQPPNHMGKSPIYATAPRPPKDVAITTSTFSGDIMRYSGVPHQHPKMTTRSMSQGDMLGPEEITEALLAVQRSQQESQSHHPHQRRTQSHQQHHPVTKSHESPQRRRVQGSIIQHHGHHHHHHHHHRPHTHRLHKSHSDGELLEEDEPNGAKDRAHYRSCKAVKFLARHDKEPSGTKSLGITTSEEEASDRDMPELAPIIIPTTTAKKSEMDDLEFDLGQKLSPLGSTSSLQDLIDSNSGADLVSVSQNSVTWTVLERQKLAQSAEVLMTEQDTHAGSLENGHKQQLSACEDNSEDAEEHVTSYLEQPPIKVIEKKFIEDDDEEKSPGSRKSSSSGSYSVTSGLGHKTAKVPEDNVILEGTQELKPLIPSEPEYNLTIADEPEDVVDHTIPEPEPNFEIEHCQVEDAKISPEPADVQEVEEERVEEKPVEPESKPTPAMIRKQELTLNLQKEAASLPFKSPQDFTSPDDSTSENSLMWQRLPIGTGDVQKKRQAFERQIRCLSEDTKPKILNGKVRTPSSGGVRKIVSEERANGSPMGGPSGLARSPAMHSGFRSEDWVVERTPVNTPVNDRVIVGMINLSDEETSFHASSEELCKSSGATTPQGSINSSYAPSSLDLTKTEAEKTLESKSQEEEEEELVEQARASPIPQVQTSIDVQLETQNQIPQEPPFCEDDHLLAEAAGGDSKAPVSQAEPEPAVIPEPVKDPNVPLMAPPAGFGDSPEHVPHKKLPGFHEAISDQILPHEELLIAEDFAPPVMPTLQIAESFQSQDNLSSVRKESYHLTGDEAPIDYRVVEVEVTTNDPLPRPQTLERQSKRKMSATSVASRASGTSSHRSRSRSRSKERLLSKLAHSGDIVITSDDDDDVGGMYLGAYDRSAWAFIGKLSASSSMSSGSIPGQLIRSDSIESTQSEREFRKKYQAITHRMVHRKSSAVMYSRILERTFECNKTVRVRRVRGEFGFRIHGSRPVVVSAIEPNTPAETSGLEVGDIILTINGINVLDLPHTEVVKTAQTGSDELELGLARVPELSYPEDPIDIALGRLDDSLTILYSGYLWKLSRSVVPGAEGTSIAKWSRRFFVLRADSCLYFFKQEHESRPLGAILVSGCTILEGCEAEDQQAGLGRSFAFRLIFSVQTRPPCPHRGEMEVHHPTRILCLATDTKEELTPWLNVIDHCAQSQENVDDLWRALTEHRQQLSAGLFPRPDCRGYLLKLDAKSRTWKRRFCVLADACLYVYTSAESQSAFATLCLHGYRVQSTGSIGGTKRHVFELIPPEQGMKFFYFLAETETEKKRWLASLEYSMDRWMKLS